MVFTYVLLKSHSTDHFLKMFHKILLAFAGYFGCAGEAHAPRADGGVLSDFKQF